MIVFSYDFCCDNCFIHSRKYKWSDLYTGVISRTKRIVLHSPIKDTIILPFKSKSRKYRQYLEKSCTEFFLLWATVFSVVERLGRAGKSNVVLLCTVLGPPALCLLAAFSFSWLWHYSLQEKPQHRNWLPVIKARH